MVRGVAAVAMGGLLVAGCSDGGTNGGGGPAPFPPEARSFDALIDQAEDIFAVREDLDYTDPSSLPDSGRATYTGVLGAGPHEPGEGLIDGSFVAADFQIAVDLGADSVSAQATNFVSDLGERLEGVVEFEDGFLDRDVNPDGGGWTFGAEETSGVLTTAEGEQWRVLEGLMLGDFFGDSPSHAAGPVEIDLVSNATGQVAYLDGGFEAVRD